MTTEEKRKALADFCDKQEMCSECPLHIPQLRCGRGQCFDLGKHAVPDYDIEMAFNIAYPEGTTPTIKDSGNRREFGTGAVRDMAEGKGRMDLLPWAAIMEISKHCENDAKKYGEHNVDKGIPTHSLCDSAERHLAKYLDGWDDEPHLLAAAWNLLWAIQMELKHPEVVDTPWKGGDV